MELGKFIVLEGIDGSGTTTQAQRLSNYLFEKDKKNIVTITREPTKLSIYGQELHRRLEGKLLPGEEVIDAPEYWRDLFINDRQWHLDHIIVPALYSGQHVIADRHKLSTIAYQTTQGLEMDDLIYRHRAMYQPNLTVILTVAIDIARERAERTGRTAEYFDRRDFQQKVQENYLVAVEKIKAGKHHYLDREERIVVVDGGASIDEVARAIQQEVNVLFGYA